MAFHTLESLQKLYDEAGWRCGEDDSFFFELLCDELGSATLEDTGANLEKAWGIGIDIFSYIELAKWTGQLQLNTERLHAFYNYVDGQLHSKNDQPARVHETLLGMPDELGATKVWYNRGEIHRGYGPAIEKRYTHASARYRNTDEYYRQGRLIRIEHLDE